MQEKERLRCGRTHERSHIGVPQEEARGVRQTNSAPRSFADRLVVAATDMKLLASKQVSSPVNRFDKKIRR